MGDPFMNTKQGLSKEMTKEEEEMENNSNIATEFPGFDIFVPNDEYMFMRRPALSRLQKKAPRPLALECMDISKTVVGNRDCSSSSSLSSSSFFRNKAPIPLLSPLILSPLPDPSYKGSNTTATSH